MQYIANYIFLSYLLAWLSHIQHCRPLPAILWGTWTKGDPKLQSTWEWLPSSQCTTNWVYCECEIDKRWPLIFTVACLKAVMIELFSLIRTFLNSQESCWEDLPIDPDLKKVLLQYFQLNYAYNMLISFTLSWPSSSLLPLLRPCLLMNNHNSKQYGSLYPQNTLTWGSWKWS